MFFYETDFKIEKEEVWKNWLKFAAKAEGFEIDNINYVFCGDDDLLRINTEFLNHDYYTDVIGFQFSEGKNLSGDIYVSIDRVKDNALKNNVKLHEELARVMIHGILHFMNYKDKTEEETAEMRKSENRYLAFFDEIN
ncbi:MAG: rRNA maturation RNase YbeY [Weeksellaceae bacterium]